MKTVTKHEALTRFLTEVVGVQTAAPLTEDESYRERYRGYSDTLELDTFIHTVPRDQLEVMVCLHLGMKPAEIAQCLRYPSVVRYYNISASLRKTFRERKPDYQVYT